nr:unnamed protein product [Leishmania braziliensis]CAJ2466609.1 unnamed protein product [Leishmania braziliensis]
MTVITSMRFSKPLTVILSDISFLGHTKWRYITLSCIVGAICAVAYVIFLFEKLSVVAVTSMILLSVFYIMIPDVLSEGHDIRRIRH